MLNARLYRVGARRTRVCGLPRCTAMHDARDALALTPASAPYLLSLSLERALRVFMRVSIRGKGSAQLGRDAR